MPSSSLGIPLNSAPTLLSARSSFSDEVLNKNLCEPQLYSLLLTKSSLILVLTPAPNGVCTKFVDFTRLEDRQAESTGCVALQTGVQDHLSAAN